MKRGVGVLVFLAAASCGPSASDYAYERTTHACASGICAAASVSADAGVVDGGMVSEALEPWPDETAGLLSGVFAVHVVVTANVLSLTVSLQLLFRLRLLQETTGPTNVMQSISLCALKLPSVKNIATITIPTRLQTIIQEKSVEISSGNFLSMEGATQTYKPPPILFVVGARLANPLSDPLPTQMDLTGEWDEDMDGHPGVTVNASVFTCTEPQELYAALRTGGTLRGTVTGFDKIEGTVDIFETESILGYSDPCLAAAADIMTKLNPETTFQAQRLADEAELHSMGNVSCDDIVAQAPMLYGTEWTD